MGEARRRREQERIAALAAYAVVAFDEPAEGQKRVAPTEFRLFHAGVNHTAKGDFTFDDAAASSVMAAYAARQTPLMADYEHQSLASPPIKAPASATQWVPEVRRDASGGPELWATQVQWTNEARTYLENGEYRLHSPAFIPDEDGRIKVLINFALTNLPASYGLEPLVAASEPTPEKEPMDEKELQALKDKLTGAEKERADLSALCEKMKALVLKRLGKSFDDWAAEEEAEHEEAKAALKALTVLKDKVLELTGKADTAEALGVLALALNQGKELVALKQKLADEHTKSLETEFAAVLDAAVAGGKLPPAGAVSKEFFVGLKADIGTEKALSALKKAIPAEPIVQLRAPTEPTPAAAVSAAEVQIAGMCGGRFGGTDQLKAMREAEQKARAGAPTT